MTAICLRLLAAVLLLAPAGTAAEERAAAQELFRQGRAFHTGEGGVEADPEKALRLYLQALKAYPSFYEAHVNAGKIYYGRKDYRRAKGHLSEAIKLARARRDISAADEARISSDLGSCYFQEGNHAEAEKWFRGALGLDDGLVEAHYNLINLLLATDRRDEARQRIKAAAELAPSSQYAVFEGRLKSGDAHDAWNPQWLKVGVGGVVLGLIGLAVLRKILGGGRDGRRMGRRG